MTDSTVSGNFASSAAGGIYTFSGSQLTVLNSTISGNTAGTGGGIGMDGADENGGSQRSTLTLRNSTVSGNSASSGSGGGLYLDRGAAFISDSTVTGNYASSDAGGIYLFRVPAVISRTIVSGNIADGEGSEVYADDGNPATTLSRNVFGHSGITSEQAFYYFTPGSTDVVLTSNGGGTPTALSSILGSLASNGGPTRTHALVTGSPAIDLAPSAECTGATSDSGGFDQRGFIRPAGSGCDAGSFEFGAVAPGGVTPANGTCGTASGVATSSAPTMNLCGVGTLTAAVTGSAGAWRWTCDGTGGGMVSPSCLAPYQSQEISLSASPTSIAVGATSTITRSSTSGLSVTLSRVGSGCTLSGTTVTGTNASQTCTINANQAGTGDSGTSRFLTADQKTTSLTITAAPAARSISIADVSISEGNSGTRKLRFKLHLSAAATSPVTVRFASANGTARSGSDYTAKSGTITFAPGVVQQQAVILVKGDSTREPSETFVVNLSNPSSGTTIADNQGRGTITNDD
ncbi:MAG: choice-of-anchor Q domain-containing protein [Panacagrimonas sp.]